MHPDTINKIDKQGYIHDLTDFPNHIMDAYELAQWTKVTGKFDKIVVSGMGGSGIGGDILKAYMEEYGVLVFVNKSYEIPKYVNDKTLLFVLSYSGNTEETTEAFKHALKTRCEMIAITTGGKLKELCDVHHKKCIIIPKGHQPRAAFAYLFIPMLRVLENSNAISSVSSVLKNIAKQLSSPIFMKKAEELARNIKDKIPIIYTADRLSCVGLRWKTQFNENTKMHAFCNVFSEMNHNEIVGYTKKLARYHMIIISSEKDHPRIKMRFKLVKKLVKDQGVDVTEMAVSGDSLLEEIFSAIHIGDWTSYFLAILYGMDPSPVEIIENLKRDLKKE
jgi:glucose/mannose-6-phosphate isomerase